MFVCKHCSIEFVGFTTSQKANHSRWCDSNPKRSSYKIGKIPKQFSTEEARIKRIDGLKRAHSEGKYNEAYKKAFKTRKANGKHLLSESTKIKISEKALASNHRRLLRSVREYTKKDGTKVLLDSSWEEALATRLDQLNVDWIRPSEPIKYETADGKIRNYFPDFYLPSYDVFLDPKNPAAVAAQKNKLDVLKKTIYNLVIIYSLEECRSYNPAGVAELV